MPERRLLLLCLCSVLGFSLFTTATDLFLCRIWRSDCEKQAAAFAGAAGMAAGYISGILTKSPE